MFRICSVWILAVPLLIAAGAQASAVDSIRTLTSTSAENLIFAPEEDLTPRLYLSYSQMIGDLATLQTAAQAAYAGPDLMQALEAVRSETPPISNSKDFCQRLQARLAQVRDSHLRAALIGQSCGRKSLQGHVGPNLGAAQTGWSFHLKDGLPVVSIVSYLPADDSSWLGFTEKIEELKESRRPFVLDLRGNTGGDDEMAVRLAQILYDLKPEEGVPTPVEAWLRRQTPEAFALLANSWALAIARIQRSGGSVPAYYFDRREQTLGWMKRAQHGDFPPVVRLEKPVVSIQGRDVFSQAVYVLIDGACASSCEMQLEYLEALPHRVLVGETTSGMVDYGEIGKLVLPSSRVIVSLATFSSRYRDYRNVEKVGYAPDILVKPGQDAWNFIPRP